MRNGLRGRIPLLASALVAVLALVAGLLAGPASAAPGDDDEGGTTSLREALDTASQGFIDAQATLEHSRQRQIELTQELTITTERLLKLQADVDDIVDLAYRTGRLWMASTVLEAGSPTTFADRVATVELVATRQDRQVRDLARTKDRLTEAKQAIDAEIVSQQTQVTVMAKKKEDAERALAAAGTGAPTNGPDQDADADRTPTPRLQAAPAPRRGNNSLASEGCSVNDPTTSGCITARTLHAMQQAKGAGFTRFVSCFRPSGGGEHPKGRACDFAAQSRGFGGVATGGDKTYGTNLANYFIANASALGVLYVIWFKRIWLPSSGWRAYTRGQGDPSSDHTNHVHLSMR